MVYYGAIKPGQEYLNAKAKAQRRQIKNCVCVYLTEARLDREIAEFQADSRLGREGRHGKY
jgi:hypothetical protein